MSRSAPAQIAFPRATTSDLVTWVPPHAARSEQAAPAAAILSRRRPCRRPIVRIASTLNRSAANRLLLTAANRLLLTRSRDSETGQA
jgi:hypothetical protein